jgi:alkylation response protein AidB-like acyl-CoA dehydrogenase
MVIEADNQLLEAAQALGPTISKYGEATERDRRPPKPVIDALARAGLYRMFTPRSLGGLEVDPITFARVIEEISGFDSAAGWSLMTGNSADWWCSRLPDAGAEEVYDKNPSAIIAAAFHPPVPAVEVNGGYRLNGQRPLASNIHEAQWILLTGLIMDGDQPKLADGYPQVIAAVLRAQEAEIVDTWHTLGMRGTDSNDVSVKNVFVPKSRTFPLAPEFQPGRHYQGPLYRLPAMGEVAVVMAPVLLAMARGSITELRSLAEKKTAFGFTKPLRDRAVVQVKLARAEAVLRSARLLLYDTLATAWERVKAGELASLEQRADLLLAAAYSVSASAEVVDLMFSVAGTSAIYTRSRLERYFRDVNTLKHHGFASEGRFETVGQVYLGVTPEFGFVGF